MDSSHRTSDRSSNSARARLRSRQPRAGHVRQDSLSPVRMRGRGRSQGFSSSSGRYSMAPNSSRVPQLMSSSRQEQAMRRAIMRRNSRVIQSLPIIALVLVIIAVIFAIVYFNSTIK